MRRMLCLCAVALLWPLSVAAASKDEISRLYEAVGVPSMIGILVEEGRSEAADVGAELFPGRDGWARMTARIYDRRWMDRLMQRAFSDALQTADVNPLLDFFQSPRGRRIVSLEVSARQALLDPDVEDAARDRFQVLEAEGGSRLRALRAYVEANDLVEMNVAAAMNANLAFFRGMAEAKGAPFDEAAALDGVRAQESDIRASAEDWIYLYLAMAYAPLDQTDLDAYVALSRTRAGRELNGALFAAFDALLNATSAKLGEAAARFGSGEEL